MKPYPIEFVRDVLDDVAEVWRRLGGRTRYFTFGPLRIELRTFKAAPLDELLPSISHGHMDHPGGDPVIIYALDAKATGMAPPPAIWPQLETVNGQLPGAYWSSKEGIAAASDADRGIWSLYDMASSTMLCWYRDAADLPEWERTAPFRIALHWAALSVGAQMVHCAAIGKNGRGVLMTGPGGSGKSTTTAAAIDRGLETSGEDFVLIEGQAPPLAHAVFDTLKLTGMALDAFTDLAREVVNPGRPEGEKACVHLGQTAAENFVSCIAIKGLASLSLGHGDRTTWRQASPVVVLQALAPSTMFLLRTAMDESFANLSRLVRGLPCYQFDLGRDLREVAAALERFIEELPE